MENKEQLLQKYLEGRATSKESRQVIDWLMTEEGAFFFENQYKKDLSHIKNYSEKPDAPQELLSRINKSIELEERAVKSSSSGGTIRRIFFAAAILLIICSAGYFYFQEGSFNSSAAESADSRVIETTDDEQRIVTLSDGSTVRLAEGSKIEIAGDFGTGKRSLQLTGQAFFDVASQQEPFLIRAGEAYVEVLGTRFTVNTNNEDNIVVAVEQGSVSVAKTDTLDHNAINLEKDMVGIVNKRTGELQIFDTDVSNYTAWIHGRIHFDGIYFEQVLAQLNHIYGFRHEIHDEEILNKRLSADLPHQSADGVFQTIAYSLGIEVEISGKTATWRSL